MEKLQKSLFTLLFVLWLSVIISAQQGTIRGSIFDASNGESLIAVTVAVAGTGTGTTSDFDGTFELNLAPGTYNLEVSYISYKTMTITDVVVTDSEVTLLENIQLATESELIDEIVITAEVIRSSETALMTLKKKSTSLVDGISSAKFKKIGDSNAGAAVKRVTGVSVEGGKYVFVRGLGDRYTKTMLNGVDIPGLDPDRNSLQIDIFPTNLLNNMMIHKSALAELPADFTGGVVNIETKDFPEEKTFNVSLGMGFTPGMHLNDDYLYAEGGSTDFLGFDDGTRKLPGGADARIIPSPVSGHSQEDLSNFLNDFSPELATSRKSAMPDFSVGVSYGDQKTLKNDHKIGYTFSTTYKSSRRYFNNVNFGEYQLQGESDVFDLVPATTTNGQIGEENVLLGGMFGLAYKTNKSKHKLSFIHLQNGESKAAVFDIDNNSDATGQSGFLAQSDNIEYSQRSLSNILLNGNYAFENEWMFDWKLSGTLSQLTDPDIRKTAFSEFGSNNLGFVAGAGGDPSRIWRYLDEYNLVGKVDFAKKFQFFDEEAKLKFGASHIYKQRDYNILSYRMQFFGAQPTWAGDASEVLTPENIAPNGPIYYVSGNNTPNPNEYSSNVNNTGLYVSTEIKPTASLKATVGLRAEKYIQKHTGRDSEFANSGVVGNNLEDAKVLDAIDLFPSVNLIQSMRNDQNLRISYSRSIARPSFKELSFAQILDPITDRIFNGSLFQYTDKDGNVTWDGNLTETRINNFDLRWEMFSEGGQLLSVSAFFKTFDNPIELVRIPTAQTSNEFQTRNVGDAQVYGIELELRRNLPIGKNSLNLSTNVTFAQSILEMSELEYDSRLSFEKEGQTIATTRQMAGQAPFIINAGLSYNLKDTPLDCGLYYNVRGRTLEIAGGGLFPDVYAKSFHSINFSANYATGDDDRISLGLNVDNLLNSRRESVFGAFNAEDQFFSQIYPGRSIGISLGYKLI